MKGIAILCVILGHINELPAIGKNLIFSFHMPLFFIVAGYFFKPVKNYKAKLSKDLKRLIIPYILTGGVIVLYSFLVHFILKQDHENAYLSFWAFLFPTGLKGIVSANSYPIWFLCALFWCRQVYNIVFTKNKKWSAIILVLIISLGATLLYDYGSVRLPLAIIQGLSGMTFYLVGWLICQYKKHFHWYCGLFSFLIWIVCFRYCYVDMIVCYYRNILLAIIVAICGTISIYNVSKGLMRLNKISVLKFVPFYLEWAGASSMVILCIHTIERYLPFWEIIGVKPLALLFLGKVILCSVITFLCYKFRFTRTIFQLKEM